MIVCPQCGGSFPESETFCRFCGYAAPKVESPTTDTTPDDAANPNALLTSETEARDVPSNILAAIKMRVVRGGLKGRSSRVEFWPWILLVLILWFSTPTLATTFLRLVNGAPLAGVFWKAFLYLGEFLEIVALLLTFTLCVRRFHDVGLVGITAYIFLVLEVVCLLFGVFPSIYDLQPVYVRRGVAGGLLISGFAILIVGLIPGTKGPNQYGPPPVKREASQENDAQNSEARR